MVEGKKVIRNAFEADLKVIFQLYVDYMFDSHLLNLGHNFVKQYLNIIVKSKNCISLVAEDSDIVGFIMAALNSRRLFWELMLDGRLLLYYLWQLLICPRCFFQTLELIFYPLKVHIKGVNSEFLFIAIKPQERRKKIAVDLITTVLSVMKKNRIEKVQVSTSKENIAINILLKKIGFKQEKNFSLFKKNMCLYDYELN